MAGFFLSPQQGSIWRSGGEVRAQVGVVIEGSFDEARLRAALEAVVKASDALRTVFQRQMGMKMPFQVVLDVAAPVWSNGPAASVGEVMEREALEPMAAEGSQVRSALGLLPDATTTWVLTAHSAVADAKSMQLLVAGTLKAYAGTHTVDDEAIRYAQFAQWQNDLLAGDDDETKRAARFWDRTADGGLAPVMPGEHVVGASAATGCVAIGWSGQASADVLLAAWVVMVARWSGQQRIEMGVVLEGREYEELAGLMGAVSRMVPLVASIEGHPAFREVVEQVRAEREEAVGLQEYYAPVREIKVGFEYDELAGATSVEGASFRVVLVADGAHGCALKLNAMASDGAVALELRYDPAVIGAELVGAMAESFESVLAAAMADPGRGVDGLPLVPEMRKKEMVSGWNETSVSAPSEPIHELISAQALRTPGAAAVRCEAAVLTYAELEGRSNRLARHLGSLGVRRGSLVGLSVARSAEMMVAVLGILKAGGAYVPLSADQPKARTAQQLAGIAVLVTERPFVAELPEFAGSMVLLDEGAWRGESEESLGVEVGGDDLAYVIYTSGSTGTPKGVGVRHRNLVNYATHIVRALGLEAEPRQYGTVSTLAADLGNTVIYPALLTGGCLHVLPYEVATDPQKMAAYQAEYGLDVLKIVPSHLAALLDGAGDAVLPKKYLITGGEALKPALVERIVGHGSCELINHYGPTETTVGSLMLAVKEFDWKGSTVATIPIGKPIANTRVYVLDGNRELVPIGVAGDLYIAGAGVSAGYVGLEAMTSERFVGDPFQAGEVMYRTGDLVRWLPQGVVEFLGRADDQVKIRGFRVELGEIEAVLAKEAGVRQCVVVARAKEGTDVDLQVVGYVVLDRQANVTTDALKEKLKQRLPDYMVPAAMMELNKIPLTANGKLDRKALPVPEEREAREYKAPETPTEEIVAKIWAEVLKLERVSTDENFFDLGGHSLLATQVISRVRESFQIDVALRTMFEAPVLRDFAAATDAAKANAAGNTGSGPIRRATRQAYRAGTV